MSETSKQYDAIVVFGSKPDENNRFPSHIYAALDAAAAHYQHGDVASIVLSGNYARRYDRDHQKPPFRECDAMADYIMTKGVPRSAILLEDTSKDTVANMYFTKRDVLMPHHALNILFIAADFRIERLRYLAAKILGPSYATTFEPVPTPANEVNPTEHIVMQRTRDFLEPMRDGDHHFLDDVFYSAPFYQRPTNQ